MRGHSPIGYGRTPAEAFGNWVWSLIFERLTDGLPPPIGGADYRKVWYDADEGRIRMRPLTREEMLRNLPRVP